MGRVDVKINLAGVNALMRSAAAQREVDAAGRRIAARTGDADMEYEPGRSHPWVARGYVRTTSARAARENAKSNTLLKAVSGGGAS